MVEKHMDIPSIPNKIYVKIDGVKVCYELTYKLTQYIGENGDLLDINAQPRGEKSLSMSITLKRPEP